MSEYYNNDIFVENLRKYLNQFDMTQAELAARIGVSKSTISDYMRGKKLPRVDKLDKMCEIFGCTRTALVTEQIADDAETIKELVNILRDAPIEVVADVLNYTRYILSKHNQ